jgi:hypothetical protein
MEQSDYFSLLNRAILKLDSNTPAARSEIYDRARQALRNQLGAMQPRLPDAAIAKELQQLEGAIRQLEPPQKIQAAPPRKQQTPAQPSRSVASRGIFCEYCIAETTDETPGDVTASAGSFTAPPRPARNVRR